MTMQEPLHVSLHCNICYRILYFRGYQAESAYDVDKILLCYYLLFVSFGDLPQI